MDLEVILVGKVGGTPPPSVKEEARNSGEGVLGGKVEAGVQEDAEGAKSGEDDEGPEEQAVYHDGHIFPVLL